jgi:hypothetical protein
MFRQVRSYTVAGTPEGDYAINAEIGWQTESLNARAAYGRVKLQLEGTMSVSQGNYSFSGRLSAPPDPYDFDPKPWGQRSRWGEISTRAGALLPGKPFDNIFVGDRLLQSQGVLR